MNSTDYAWQSAGLSGLNLLALLYLARGCDAGNGMWSGTISELVLYLRAEETSCKLAVIFLVASGFITTESAGDQIAVWLTNPKLWGGV